MQRVVAAGVDVERGRVRHVVGTDQRGGDREATGQVGGQLHVADGVKFLQILGVCAGGCIQAWTCGACAKKSAR